MNMLNVLLVEHDQDNTLLEKHLKDANFHYLKTTYSVTFLALLKEVTPDVVIINTEIPSDKMLADLFTLNQQQQALPVVLFSQDDSLDTIARAMKANVAAYIVDGFVAQRLNSIIRVAIARFKQQQALKEALDDALVKLEDRKQIDRAKAILIKAQNFNEDEAYHTLRKLAMDRKITLGEMARNVIAMAELLK